MNNAERSWLTIANAADYLGVSKDFIRDMIKDGLQASKVRHTVFVRREDIDNLMEENIR